MVHIERRKRRILFSETGGIKLPTFLTVNNSPGLVEANRLGTTLLSEQATNSEFGYKQTNKH